MQGYIVMNVYGTVYSEKSHYIHPKHRKYKKLLPGV